jgi:hypothetical protein
MSDLCQKIPFYARKYTCFLRHKVPKFVIGFKCRLVYIPTGGYPKLLEQEVGRKPVCDKAWQFMVNV